MVNPRMKSDNHFQSYQNLSWVSQHKCFIVVIILGNISMSTDTSFIHLHCSYIPYDKNISKSSKSNFIENMFTVARKTVRTNA